MGTARREARRDFFFNPFERALFVDAVASGIGDLAFADGWIADLEIRRRRRQNTSKQCSLC
jgi:hypothetical protein